MTLLAPTLIRYAGPPAVPGYSVGEFLGRGTTGIVWAARCQETGARVALKVIEPDGVEGVDPDVAGREEALGRRVVGSHLVTVRGRVTLEDGRLALVMNLAEGGSLRDVVTIRGALPLGEVVTALTPLATALAELHEAGVVHADVAPANVLFTPDGRPMLADLSSAWLAEDGWPTRSRGTPGFTAPEVALVQPPVPTSDVWSLGALAWYARTGGLTPPRWLGDLHWSGAVADVHELDAEDEHGTVADVVAAVGPELSPLLIRMLAVDPEVRPSAAEVALALYRTAAPEPVRLVGRHPDPAAAVTTRIRREAAETRSRSELRALKRLEERRARRAMRKVRVRGLLPPWGRGREAPSDGPRTGSWRLRLVVVALVGVILAGGMLGLLVLTGSPLELAPPAVSETSVDSGGPASAGDDSMLTGAVSATVGSATAAPAAGVGAVGAEAATPGEVTGGCSGATATSATGSGLSSDVVTCDPVGALQRLADQRAAALVAADPVLLVGAEPAGSSVYESDITTITRLREQRQRYVELTFTVRSAEVLSGNPESVMLKAVVDRSAYQVADDAGETQSVTAAPGFPLRYILSLADGGWRLTEVGSL